MSATTFEEAVEAVKAMTVDQSNQTKLELYSLFKQSTIGDCNTSRPSMMDVAGKAKWDAWNAQKGTYRDNAKTAYVVLVNKLNSAQTQV